MLLRRTLRSISNAVRYAAGRAGGSPNADAYGVETLEDRRLLTLTIDVRGRPKKARVVKKPIYKREEN